MDVATADIYRVDIADVVAYKLTDGKKNNGGHTLYNSPTNTLGYA